MFVELALEILAKLGRGSVGGDLRAQNVGSRVPAKPSRFEHWGAHEDLPPIDSRPKLAKIS